MFDTMIVATEVETAFAKRKQGRINARFLKGPILMQDIGAAARLPGQALSVFLALHHQTALTKKQWVTLPKGLLMQLGISRDAKARALQQLEAAALVRVVRSKGKTARASLAFSAPPIAGQLYVAGTSPDVLWQNAAWVITTGGMASREHLYQIVANQLAEVRDSDGDTRLAMWPLQMADKSWVIIETFIEAFRQALVVHMPEAISSLDLDQSFHMARQIAAQRRGAD